MAHDIDMTTGKAACFTAGRQPWHRLGVNVADAQTSAEAVKLAGLDWDVNLWPISATGPEGQTVSVNNQFAVVRGDTQAALGVVSGYYQPFQNREAFDFMDHIVGEKLAMFETAGAIKEGRRVWMMARIPKTLRVAGDDVINPFVLLTNSHDGTSALQIFPTAVRVVCQNTLNLALKGASSGMSIVHTESLTRRVADARQKLGIVVARMDEFEQQVQHLARKTLDVKQLGDYFAKLVDNRAEKRQQKVLEQLLENFESERQQMPGIRNTLWAAYNAVSEYADHQMGTRGTDDADRLNNRLHSIWFGSANVLKQKAFELVLSMAC